MLNRRPFPSLDLNYDRMSTLAQAALSNYSKVKSDIPDSGTTDQEVKAELRRQEISGNTESTSHLKLSHLNHVRRNERREPSNATKLSDQELSPVFSCSAIEIDDNSQGIIPTNIWCQGPD